MLRIFFLYLFLVVSILIGLGAFGHGYSARKVHAAIDQFPIDPVIAQTLYIVWYFVSGSMLTFGAMLVWVWFRLKAGDTRMLFVALLIGALYLVTGICATIYRHGDPFWFFFILLGVLLIGSSFALRNGSPAQVRMSAVSAN